MGYEERGVDRFVRDDGGLAFDEGLAALRLRPGADEPLSVLVRLFLARERLPVATVAAALAPVGVDAAAAVGLVVVRDGGVQARFALQPFEDLIIASDRSSPRLRPGGGCSSRARRL